MTRLTNNLISKISSFDVLDTAFAWLKHNRLNAHPDNPFWTVSLNWPSIRANLRTRLQAGDYQFNPVMQYQLHNGESGSAWDPLDSIVLKAMAQVLTPLLNETMNLSAATHLKAHGGLKQAVIKTGQLSHNNNFVLKADIADYYASMQHHTLHSQLCEHITDLRVQRLLWQVMNRVHISCGNHRLIQNKSIPRGCPLSPLFAAIYLQPLDEFARKNNLDYVRYMDDFVFFTKSRHQLRRIVKGVYGVIKELDLKLAPAKTWLGRASKGISFLGYEISPRGIDVAMQTFDRMKARLQRLYEQGVTQKRLVKYVNNWIKWARSGVSLDVEKLKLKTTQILQNTFDIQLPLKSS